LHACFPDFEHSADPEVREELEAWWVLTQLSRGVWQYWLTAERSESVDVSEGGAA
jgi:hypothetical protein